MVVSKSEKINNYADEGLINKILNKMCKKCEPPDGDCDGCIVIDESIRLENQILQAGLDCMDNLLKEWASI